jgi:hypothetical protein
LSVEDMASLSFNFEDMDDKAIIVQWLVHTVEQKWQALKALMLQMITCYAEDLWTQKFRGERRSVCCGMHLKECSWVWPAQQKLWIKDVAGWTKQPVHFEEKGLVLHGWGDWKAKGGCLESMNM